MPIERSSSWSDDADPAAFCIPTSDDLTVLVSSSLIVFVLLVIGDLVDRLFVFDDRCLVSCHG
jgi:hypothetical protein